jgi:cytoskeletal protein RodZ
MADTPGIILKSARESKNFNIAQVVKGTRIRTAYIVAMEADDFESLPSAVHARGFLRVYADFLGLDSSDLITKLTSDLQHPKPEIIRTSPAMDDNNEPGAMSMTDPESSPGIAPQGTILDQSEPYGRVETDEEQFLEDEVIQISDQTFQSLSDRNSARIFASIGELLRIQREALGLSIIEVEKHSRVLKHYLESIEAGKFDELPSSVQARGMLSNYARFLEIDLEEILLLYADGLQAQRVERQQSGPGKPIPQNFSSQKISALRRFVSIDLVFGVGLVLLLIFFSVWGTGRVIDLYQSPASGATAASISDIILTPLHTATVEGMDSVQTPLPVSVTSEVTAPQVSSIPPSDQGQVQVYVVVLQRTWLRIIVDNKISLEGRVEPGNAYSFYGNEQVEVLTGNGAALQITHNQIELGVMGVFGQIVDNIYTQNSIIKPTATITPTPTITPKPSITPRITSTINP